MIYINKKISFLAQEVHSEVEQNYKNQSLVQNRGEQRSTNPQTHKGLLPPHMITKKKANIFCFQPH